MAKLVLLWFLRCCPRSLGIMSLGLLLMCGVALGGCGSGPALSLEQRTFGDRQLEFLGKVELRDLEFEGTKVGGLSSLDYDRPQNRFFAIADDRSRFNPSRFYQFRLDWQQDEATGTITPAVTFTDVVTLKDPQGQEYPEKALDPEGLAITPRHTLLISTEGDRPEQIQPWLKEFDPKTGLEIAEFPLPRRFQLQEPGEPQRGIENNLGFEAIAVKSGGLTDDPFRVFTVPESALVQDTARQPQTGQTPVRLLHYGVNPIGPPVLIAEHLYYLDTPPRDTLVNGITELVTLNQEGSLLSLERSFGLLRGAGAKIFQITIGNATDTANLGDLKGNLAAIAPVQKKLLLDLRTLGFPLDNLEGMSFGPRLPDGSQSLVVISDDNFSDRQSTQILCFRFTE